MPTSAQTKTTAQAAAGDAIASLIADHQRVKALFQEFEGLKEEGSDDEKAALVKAICRELTVHATVEEEIFYPAVRKKIKEKDLMDEATVEHASAKELIAQLEDMTPGDDLYDAKVTVLGEQIEHHVAEEEGEMFPKAEKAKVDTAALSRQMDERRAELMAEMGLDEGSEESESDSEDEGEEQDEEQDEEDEEDKGPTATKKKGPGRK